MMNFFFGVILPSPLLVSREFFFREFHFCFFATLNHKPREREMAGHQKDSSSQNIEHSSVNKNKGETILVTRDVTG